MPVHSKDGRWPRFPTPAPTLFRRRLERRSSPLCMKLNAEFSFGSSRRHDTSACITGTMIQEERRHGAPELFETRTGNDSGRRRLCRDRSSSTVVTAAARQPAPHAARQFRPPSGGHQQRGSCAAEARTGSLAWLRPLASPSLGLAPSSLGLATSALGLAPPALASPPLLVSSPRQEVWTRPRRSPRFLIGHARSTRERLKRKWPRWLSPRGHFASAKDQNGRQRPAYQRKP